MDKIVLKTGRIPDLAEAVKDPLEYEVTRSLLGWTVAHVGEDVTLLISEAEGRLLLRLMEAAEAADFAQETINQGQQ